MSNADMATARPTLNKICLDYKENKRFAIVRVRKIYMKCWIIFLDN